MIKKILIANRGEIAVRVIKACQEMGISTVSIYSEVDQNAIHVQLADEAVLVGPPSPLESYLNIDKIIEISKKEKVDAIHPGYGFLAENANFAKRCEDEGLIFIGPTSKAMALLGDKIKSRQAMIKAGVPVIPGMESKAASFEEIKKEAQEIGFPVLLKASAGGGGKGMRIVNRLEELHEAMESGMREAKSAFGDDTIYLEKYIKQSRHIEFQVLADHYGDVVHLFERECSIQRRHQKIIEESPSIALDDELRKRMGDIAIKVVKSSGYTNAGTVEFLLDKEKNFYFLEVNARLQVEHPITEFVTGIDLVKQQIRIADGKKLPFKQSDLCQKGHAFECRIYAEDPENNFFPSIGKILFVEEPKGPWIRIDSGIFSDCDVSIHYDPILSKLIVWGENREDARHRLINALKNYIILGIKTQIPFLIDVIMHHDFIDGETYTDFINKHFPAWKQNDDEEISAILVAAIHSYENFKRRPIIQKSENITPWQTIGNWEI